MSQRRNLKEELAKKFKLRENGSAIYKNVLDIAKLVFRGKCITLSTLKNQKISNQ